MSKAMAMKHVLSSDVYRDTPAGGMAIALLGDEPAHELFLLLMGILLVSMAGKVVCRMGDEEVCMDVPEDPLFFEKPFYPRTMKIVERLEKKGYLDFYGENEHGIAYTLNVPAPDKRAAWCEAATNEIGQ
jgi:hypothetical protein